jgi:uncharacterized membrane protein YgdD (TMEM256/DUF423 family)
MHPLWLFIGALNGLIAVGAGAFGRHGPFDGYHKEIFAIGSNYQMVHALALLAVATLVARSPSQPGWSQAAAGICFTLGILLFCGTLYWFGWRDYLPLAGLAPTGGLLLMLGWLALLAEAVRRAFRRVP